MTFDHEIDGTPCKVEVLKYNYHPPCNTWDSDIDYYGWSELDYILLDERGHRAEWLEAKIDCQDDEDIAILVESKVKEYDPY